MIVFYVLWLFSIRYLVCVFLFDILLFGIRYFKVLVKYFYDYYFISIDSSV